MKTYSEMTTKQLQNKIDFIRKTYVMTEANQLIVASIEAELRRRAYNAAKTADILSRM